MTLEELRERGEIVWAPNVEYVPGDVVLVIRLVPRRWWERLLGLAPNHVYERYTCTAPDTFERLT